MAIVVAIVLAFRGWGKRIISMGLNRPAGDAQGDDGEETWITQYGVQLNLPW